jgi:hypothetical protein
MRRRSIPGGIGIAAVLTLLLSGCLGQGSGTSSVPAAPAMILGWSPGITQGVPLSAPLTVFFSRAVDHASVQRAFHVSPTVTGAYRWSALSVSFQPSTPLKAGSTYRFSLAPGALDDQHRRLRNSLSVNFTTGSTLQVQSATPSTGTRQVPLNGLIAVTFNHPMVALTGLGTPAPSPTGWNPQIAPATTGHGSWLGTSTWVYYPDHGLHGSSGYTITIPGSVKDMWGDPLGTDFTWSFHTITPHVLSLTPTDAAKQANPEGALQVAFDQPMDQASTQHAFSLRGSGTPVAGTTSWDGNTLSFKPTALLDPNVAYTARMGSDALAADGKTPLGKTVQWSFRVAPPPRVAFTVPAQGAVTSNGNVEIHFNSPMVQSTLDKRLNVTPSVDGMGTNLYGAKRESDNDVYAIYGNFLPSTTYTVTLAAGAQDRYGRTDTATTTLRFTTAPLPPSVVLYGMPGAGPGAAISAGRVVNAPAQVVNATQAHYRLLRISPSQANGVGSYGPKLSVPGGTLIRDWTVQTPHPLDRAKNLEVRLARPDGSPLAPGVYWLGARATPAVNAHQQPYFTTGSELVLV